MNFDKIFVTGLLGTITAASLSFGLDIYTKLAGAVAATLTVVYMLKKNNPKKRK